MTRSGLHFSIENFLSSSLPHPPHLSLSQEADGSFIGISQCKLLDDTNQTASIRCRLGQKMEAKDNNGAQLADKHV